VYDLENNEAGVSVGISHDTAEFAVTAIERWWKKMGSNRYPAAKRLLITADSGGSNSPRTRLWRWELQRLANRTGLTLELCHYPPGTSKWNKIEHRLFCHITQNWRGKPLRSLETIVDLIANTRNRAGLRVEAGLDQKSYPIGVKVTDAKLPALSLEKDTFHGDWNYALNPRKLVD